MREFARTLAAGLLLTALVRPPTPWRMRPAGHFWAMLALSVGLSVLRDRLLLAGEPADFYADGVQGDALAALLALAGAAMAAALYGQRVLTWTLAVLASAAGFWISLFLLAADTLALSLGHTDEHTQYALWLIACAWWWMVLARMLSSLLPATPVLGRAMVASLFAAVMLAPFLWIETARYWYPVEGSSAVAGTEEPPSRQAPGSAEALVYRQQDMVERAVAALEPGTPGVTDAYLLAFGADGNEDVFRNEVVYAEELFAGRFGMRGRTLKLLNHPDTTGETPLATYSNLKLALAGMAERMDRNEDLLVLFLTTHGTEDHQLYVDLQPLPLDWITPTDLRAALDAAGVDWRVVIVSACYSGGFVDSLATPMSLVITAARADRPSFGCGAEADITYFGHAFLTEALNQTTSLTGAFELARERVGEMEKAEDFEPSEPQMALGALMAQKLRDWSARLPETKKVVFQPATRPAAHACGPGTQQPCE